MTTATAAQSPPHGPHPWRDARFDPRMVLVGFALLIVASLAGYLWGDQAARKADEVAAPVAQLCERGGTTGAALADSGACGAAGEVAQGTGPFRSELVAGPRGLAGVSGAPGVGIPGRPGADSTVPGSPGKVGEPGADSTVPGAAGQNGTNGIDGANGANGVDGASPACLSEPGQCRGADGKNGVNGTNGVDGQDGQDGATGPPGPTCPSGTSLQPVTFSTPDGDRSGLGCVSDAPAQEEGP